MLRPMLIGKIHRATVTAADLDYVGSITIDADLLDAADLLPGQQVDVVDVTNGARLTTYVIAGERGGGGVGINGAAAHLVHPGRRRHHHRLRHADRRRGPRAGRARGVRRRRQPDRRTRHRPGRRTARLRPDAVGYRPLVAGGNTVAALGRPPASAGAGERPQSVGVQELDLDRSAPDHPRRPRR